MDARTVLDAIGLASPRMRLVVHPDAIEVHAGDGGETLTYAPLLAIERAKGAATPLLVAWGDAARGSEDRDRAIVVANPFDGDARSRDAVLALLKVVVAEVLLRRGGLAVLRRARVAVELRRPIAPALHDALMGGVEEGEGFDLSIDGRAVPRLARRRTREDLVLLVWRTLILGAFVVFAWWRFPRPRWEMIALALLGEAAVIREFARRRPSPV